MKLDKQETEKGCIQYADPDLRSMGIPVKVPPGFMMYRVCGNGGCFNAKHMHYVDGEASHLLEIKIRESTLAILREYFKVDPETLEPLEKTPPPPAGDGQILRPRRFA
jgi:hypothetical protein